jgi:glyoxylase-like metal-dependent hydrolase (beta-lactamase superfamily II)
VIHTPGHTEGGVCLLERGQRLLFTGDTLFAGSIGRSDLQGGSFEKLMESIKYKILPLGDDVRVLPGHGPETTIGMERELNPYVTELER